MASGVRMACMSWSLSRVDDDVDIDERSREEHEELGDANLYYSSVLLFACISRWPRPRHCRIAVD